AGWACWLARRPQRGGRAVGQAHPAVHYLLRVVGRLLVGQPAEAVIGDRRDHREDPPGQVGAAGGGVVVGGVVQRLHAGEYRVGDRHVVGVVLLERGLGEDRAGADRVEAVLLVRAARHVVAEDPAGPGVLVVAGEQGDHRQALHRGHQVVADHLAEAVGLALEGERAALHLLVVLEFDAEQADELKSHAGHARHADRRVLVGAEYLLHVALGDHVPGGRAPVARHHHAALGGDRDDRRRVRQVLDQVGGHVRAARQRTDRADREQVRGVRGEEVGERRYARRHERRLVPASVPGQTSAAGKPSHAAASLLL